MHSDVGGGYGRVSRVRAGWPKSLLSQIPPFMYKAALAAGVPLVPFSKLETDHTR